jgi:putative endonuclease
MAENHEFGKQGEDEAEKLLKNKGFEILGRNVRFGGHEMDIVAKKNKLLVVAEVKTRSYTTMGEPEEFVSKKTAAKSYKSSECLCNPQKLRCGCAV